MKNYYCLNYFLKILFWGTKSKGQIVKWPQKVKFQNDLKVQILKWSQRSSLKVTWKGQIWKWPQNQILKWPQRSNCQMTLHFFQICFSFCLDLSSKVYFSSPLDIHICHFLSQTYLRLLIARFPTFSGQNKSKEGLRAVQ